MTAAMPRPALGAIPDGHGIRFRVWAPAAETLELVLEPDGRSVFMTRSEGGYFETTLEEAPAGQLYRYRLDGDQVLPDPASRFQPQGVHGPSQVIDPGSHRWQDAGWQGVPKEELVFYELHVGTFTPEGSFEGVRRKLPYLKELGVSALELMPVADFPGERNWGYDPAALFAPSRAYGHPDELRGLVDEAHAHGLAVYLDVVYNHLGPDGAYAAAYSPFFFTERHQTPWGQAVNLDGEGCEGVRAFFIENALHWLGEYHIDGLRLDATFALIDDSDTHFLAELAEAIDALPGPPRRLVAEDHRNLNTLVLPREAGGYGLDAVWSDDFHHQMRRILAGDRWSYYSQFSDKTADLSTTLEQGWFYTGQVSKHEGGPRGSDPEGLRPEQFVVCIQNHDQIGNRPQGDRLHHEVMLPAYRAASAVLLFAPQLPLLFMGQEWAAGAPFQYFTDHNEELGRLVSEGRRQEFGEFPGFHDEVPDPQDPATYRRSRLDWHESEVGEHACTLELYRDLLKLRRELGGPLQADSPSEGGLVLRRGRHVLLAALRQDVTLPLGPRAEEVWCSEDEAYSGAPRRPAESGGRVHFPVPAAVLYRTGG